MNVGKVLVTGANGFIGAFIVEEAQKKGLSVYAAVRKGSDVSALHELNPVILEIDYNNLSSIAEMLAKHKFEYIIHNAGVTKTPDPNEYMLINVDYLKHMIDAIRKSGIPIKKFLYVSSLASIGPADFQKDGILNETSIPHPVTHYGRSKLAAEIYLNDQKDIPFLIIRPTAVYGPREKDLLNVFQMVNKHIEINPGFLPQKLTFIYVKDLVDLMIKALLSNHQHKAYYATDGNVYTGDALSGFIRESLNKRTFKIKLPILMLQAIAYCSEKISGLWNSYPPLNIDKFHEIKARNWNCDVRNLYTDLGFKAEYDLKHGIDATCIWYKKNNWL